MAIYQSNYRQAKMKHTYCCYGDEEIKNGNSDSYENNKNQSVITATTEIKHGEIKYKELQSKIEVNKYNH